MTFTLDDETPADAPFVLDDEPVTTESTKAAGPAPSMRSRISTGIENLRRPAALTGRALATGAAGVGDMFNLLNHSYQAGKLSRLSAGLETPGFASQLEEQMDRTGIAKPVTSGEKLYSAAISAIPGSVVPGAGMGSKAMQLFGGISGSVASEATAQAGGGTAAQIGAGIFGNVTPAGIQKGVAELTRRAFRGGEGGLEHLLDTVKKYRAAGIEPTALMATDNRRSNWLESIMAYDLGSSGVMAKAKQRVLDQLGTRANQNVNALSKPGSDTEIGRAIIKGVEGDDGFRSTFKGKSKAYFEQSDAALPKDHRTALTDTQKTLATMNADMPGAPAISQLWKNGKIVQIEQQIKSDVGSAEALLSRPDLSESERALVREHIDTMAGRGRIDHLAKSESDLSKSLAAIDEEAAASAKVAAKESRGNLGAITETRRAADADIAARRAAINDQITDVRSTIANRTSAEDLGKLVESMKDGKVPQDAVKRLRTLVGEQLEGGMFMDSVPRSRWKSLYAALSNDMEQSIRSTGNPKAIKAFEHAQAYYKNGMAHMDRIDKVIDAQNAGGVEMLYSAAFANTDKGATTLRSVMSALPEDTRKFMTASFVKRMGLAPSNTAIKPGSFSPEAYLTAYGNLSPEAQQVLFKSFGPKWADDMANVEFAARKLRERGAQFHAPEMVVQVALGSAKLGTLIGGIVKMNPAMVAGAVAAFILPNRMAAVMVSPKFLSFLSSATDKPVSALPGLITNLSREANAADDEDMKDVVKALRAMEDKKATKGPSTRRRSRSSELNALSEKYETE